MWIESASALATDCPHKAEPSLWKDEEHPEGLPGFKVSAKDTVLKFDGRTRPLRRGPHFDCGLHGAYVGRTSATGG